MRVLRCRLDTLADRLTVRPDGPPDDTLVVCAPDDAWFVGGPDALVQAYAPFAPSVVVAAGCQPVEPGRVGDYPQITSPLRFVAPEVVVGPLGALRELVTAERDPGPALEAAYLSGADMVLDVDAELVAVPDGTGTDLVRLAEHLVVVGHTGGRPLLVGGPAPAAPAGDDLARLLGYEGAMAEPGEAHAVAAEILRTPFWTPQMCAAVIRAAEAAGQWAADPDDPVPGCEVSLSVLSPILMASVEAHLEQFVAPAWRAHWPEFAWRGIHDAFVIKSGPALDAPALPLHHDIAQISGSVRLNDGAWGGTLEFARQSFDNGSVPVGDLIAWPSLVTHPHRGRPVERGVKYALTIWLRLPT